MKARARPESEDVVAFVGPSIPASEVLAMGACRVVPPARQGDVWRAMERRPRVIALIDGVFESVPSVWHRELISALDAGIAVFGGASMGALRAVELASEGMVGVGQIFRWYRDGVIEDDSEVALLHGGIETGYASLTVPLVQVRHWIAKAGLRGGEARRELDAAERIFWQDRTIEVLAERLGAPVIAQAVRSKHDLKREDARACIEAALVFARGGVAPPVRPDRSSSFARRMRLLASPEAATLVRAFREGGASAEAIRRSRARELLVALGLELGLVAKPETVSVGEADEAMLSQVLEAADRLVNDGASDLESFLRGV